jgi:hypothetical protein
MARLSKSIEEYLEAGGWSSSLFFEHAKKLFEDRDIKRSITIEVGRSVVYLRSMGTILKVYVHKNGRSKEFMTLVKENGDEFATLHYTVTTEQIKQKIFEYFRN